MELAGRGPIGQAEAMEASGQHSLQTCGERLRRGLDALAAVDRDVARALARIGYPEPRLRQHGFATLLRIIVAQQLSTRAAAAIQGRLEAVMAGRVGPDALLTLSEPELRGAGLSARKVAYARHLAAAFVEGRIDPATLASAPDEVVIEQLTALPGIGRWSAEIYLLFTLQRLDVLPADDLALQIGFQRLKGLPERPKAKAFREATLPWAPWRGAAAVFLWHFYGAATLDAGS